MALEILDTDFAKAESAIRGPLGNLAIGLRDEIAQAVATERQRCAKIAEDWIELFGARVPEHVTAQKWATDAVKDIVDAIRSTNT
jgi:hypothetical protein